MADPTDTGQDDRPSVYSEGDHWVYRASSFGNCIKELVATRVGLPPAPFPAQFRKVFADGHRGEDVIISMLEARGFTVTRRQEEINWEVIPGVIIRGHIDGVSQYLDEPPAIFDAKTTTAKYGIADHLMAKYDWQLSIYGYALGLDRALLGVGIKDPSTGDVVSVDTHIMDTLPTSKLDIVKRVALIERLAREYEETGVFPECDTENRYPCSQFRLHEDENTVDPYGGFAGPVLEDNSLDRLCAMYVEAQQLAAQAKDDQANARKMIVEHIGGEGEDRTTDKFAVAWSGTGIKKELDKRALAKFLAAHGKTIEEFEGTKSAAKSISVKGIA